MITRARLHTRIFYIITSVRENYYIKGEKCCLAAWLFCCFVVYMAQKKPTNTATVPTAFTVGYQQTAGKAGLSSQGKRHKKKTESPLLVPSFININLTKFYFQILRMQSVICLYVHPFAILLPCQSVNLRVVMTT